MRTSLLLLLAIMVSCAQMETQVHQEKEVRSTTENGQQILKEFKPDIILDVREPFDFELAHHPKAISFSYQDYSFPKTFAAYPLEFDQIVRRLALKGIQPNSKILILVPTSEEIQKKDLKKYYTGYAIKLLSEVGIHNFSIIEWNSLTVSQFKEMNVPNAQFWEMPKTFEDRRISDYSFRRSDLKKYLSSGLQKIYWAENTKDLTQFKEHLLKAKLDLKDWVFIDGESIKFDNKGHFQAFDMKVLGISNSKESVLFSKSNYIGLSVSRALSQVTHQKVIYSFLLPFDK